MDREGPKFLYIVKFKGILYTQARDLKADKMDAEINYPSNTSLDWEQYGLNLKLKEGWKELSNIYYEQWIILYPLLKEL